MRRIRVPSRHPTLRAHVVDTSVHGRLSSARVLEHVGEPSGLSVFMCGPQGMLRTFATQLRAAGVPPRRIHREYFDWR